MPFYFDYVTLFTFYASNLEPLPPINFWYFVQINKANGTWRDFCTPCDTGFTFPDGSTIYISFPLTQNDDLYIFFNINDSSRKYKTGILADHLTFGVKDENKQLIDLHLTVQKPFASKDKVDHIKCFLRDKQFIQTLGEIVCANFPGDTLLNTFPNNIITLVEKLFTNIPSIRAGWPTKLRILFTPNKKSYLVRTDKHQQKYIVKSKNIVYLQDIRGRYKYI
jgi:hypothetical protein